MSTLCARNMITCHGMCKFSLENSQEIDHDCQTDLNAFVPEIDGKIEDL